MAGDTGGVNSFPVASLLPLKSSEEDEEDDGGQVERKEVSKKLTCAEIGKVSNDEECWGKSALAH